MTHPALQSLPFTLPALRAAYAAGIRPEAVIAEAFARLDALGDPGILIHDARAAALAEACALGSGPGRPDDRPLWGVPFVVKDNIDVAGLPTTAACADFAYLPQADATVVAALRAAGAICLGKANLDQFATGLVGTRTPWPVPRNALDPAIVPGGSSGGSGVAVAAGIAAFALGTDTAGSGRVPAALNGIVGLKPSLGALSATGMVPACRTLDTVSVFALTVADAWEVFAAAAAFDPADGYSRAFAPFRPEALPPGATIAVPDAAALAAGADADGRAAFAATAGRLRAQGFALREIDMAPFFALARLLYDGAWLAERAAALGERLTAAPDTLHPVTRAIIARGLVPTAVDAFRADYARADLRRACQQALEGAALLMVPSIPRFVTRAEDAADPIAHNSALGTWTNFVNLLDLCGLAVPTGPRGDGRPGSVTLLAAAGLDGRLAWLAERIEAGPMGALVPPRPGPALATAPATGEMTIAVCGAHMSGLPLNPQLTGRGGRFLGTAETSADYRLYALAGGGIARPGLVRGAKGSGAPVPLELWALPLAEVGGFLAGIPAPLGLGTIRLADGGSATGFLCEGAGLAGATDITASGGWRGYLAAQALSPA
ncbi:allophanate hydrolase [Frigidibacter sp. MR17.24]|uniref:allophanate hydrolase n=1 Tax=Frigidibacter sp. MR17.24 TaxID=3127345 RepID=UPI0030130FC0